MTVKQRAMTVRQSVAPANDFREVDVQLSIAGTAQALVILGGPGKLECVRKFTFFTDLAVYIDLSGAVAVNDGSKDTSILIPAGAEWYEENVDISPYGDGSTSQISFINAVGGERPTINGYVAGY